MGLLKNVEPDIIFRHFALSVIFIASVAYYINNYIMPVVESYKDQQRFTRTTQQVLAQTKAVNADAKEKIASFSSANFKQLEVFSGKINESVIQKNMPKGFLRLNIKKLNEEFIPQEQLKQTHYTISGEVAQNNLNLVLSIVPVLQSKNISATFELPFSIKKIPAKKKGAKDTLSFSMGIAITQSTYKRM